MAVVLSDSKRERNALQWSQQFSVALEDCHNHLKEIFEAKQLDHSTCDFCIETSKTNQPSTVLCTPESLARRFSVLLAMLTDKTVASVTVPMGEVLNLSICLCNTTFLHHITKDVGGAKLLNVFLDVLIQLEMQTGTAALFRLSSKKIAAKVLLPLFDLTSHMVADMINSWASVRSLVYRLTANMVLHGSLAYATLNDLIVANLFGFLKDLGLTETEVVWKEQEKPAVFLSKSAKKNRKRQKLQESLLEVAVVLKQPVETWKVALMLNCANLVLNSIYSSAAFLKPEVFRTLQARVIKFCLKVRRPIN